MKASRWSLIAGVVVLALSMLLQVGFRFRETAHRRSVRLKTAVPGEVTGWTVKDEPLGATEAVRVTSTATLNYDEYLHRSYSRGASRFVVYAAYWGPGKMPARAVASHTPDRCWTENGMRCLEMKFKQAELWTSQATPPVEWRLFQLTNGAKIHVLYWHLVEGRLHDYGGRFNAVPHPWHWWKDVLSQATLGAREQLFVRVNSDVPFADLAQDTGFQQVMSALGRLGN